jgi:hypothetical protein
LKDSRNHPQNYQAEYLTGTEVPVVTSIVQSPIKVVCHSPRRVKKEVDGREVIRGYTDKASRVEVSGVTRIMINNTKDHNKQSGIPAEGSLSEGTLIHICMV